MGLACFRVGPAEPVEGANKNYESEGRTFESFRARQFLLKNQRFLVGRKGSLADLTPSRIARTLSDTRRCGSKGDAKR